MTVAALIHINGLPGVGKSTLARRYADERPLTLLLEIDAIRVSLGGWREHEESRLAARLLALAMTRAHLETGHDVIVPQYIGRPDFIAALDQAAVESGAVFVEVVVEAETAVAVERFRARRAELVAGGQPHPEMDVDEHDIEGMIADASARLGSIAGARVIATSDFVETYEAMCRAITAGKGAQTAVRPPSIV